MSGTVESSPGSGVAAETSSPAGGDTSVETAAPVESTAADTSFLIPDEVMNSSDLDEVEIPTAQAAKTPEPEAPAPTPEVAKVDPKASPAAVAKPATPAQPAKTPEQPKVATADQQPSGRPQVVADRQALLGELAKNRSVIIDHLAGERFKLSKEESDLFDTDANAGIQKIAARVYYEATTSALNLIDRFVKSELPGLIDGHTQSTMQYSKAEDGFWKEWPNLDVKADGQTVNQYANIYRQANPQASMEDAIRHVGAIVSTVLGKPKGVAAAPVAARPNGAKPFTPASGAARVVSQTQVQAPVNPFSGLGEEFE